MLHNHGQQMVPIYVEKHSVKSHEGRYMTTVKIHLFKKLLYSELFHMPVPFAVMLNNP